MTLIDKTICQKVLIFLLTCSVSFICLAESNQKRVEAPPMPTSVDGISQALSDESDDFVRRGTKSTSTSLSARRGLAGIVDDPPKAPAKIKAELTRLEFIFTELPRSGALIQFDHNSARLRPGTRQVLDEYVKAFLEPLSDARLIVAGHTDDTGSESINWVIGRQRAAAVKDYLVDHGIAAERLIIKSFGEFYPIAPNNSEANRQSNRRTEFIRIGSL